MVAYACRFEPDPPGHVVTCRDLPVVTWGETLPEGDGDGGRCHRDGALGPASG